VDLPALEDPGRDFKVFQPAVRARPDERLVEGLALDFAHRLDVVHGVWAGDLGLERREVISQDRLVLRVLV